VISLVRLKFQKQSVLKFVSRTNETQIIRAPRSIICKLNYPALGGGYLRYPWYPAVSGGCIPVVLWSMDK